MRVITEISKWGEFVKISHTVFALPFALASMILASRANNGWPGWQLFVLILICMVTARTSAMAFNRIVDRDFDAANPRTRNRHLPAGQISLRSATLLCSLSAAAFITATWFINSLCFALSPIALATVYFYSLTKRFTSYTHLFLGIALALAPLGAWLAVKGNWGFQPLSSGILIPLLMGLGVTLWLVGFDIIYATQDYDFDRETGLRSMVVRFGIPTALNIAWISHCIMWLCFLVLGLIAEMGFIYFSGMAIILVCMNYEHIVARNRNLDWVNLAFFKLNALISIVYLASILLEISIFVN
jgi:4-hydroxybenzoate polyprenyltransferase